MPRIVGMLSIFCEVDGTAESELGGSAVEVSRRSGVDAAP
jgi:hypothetical protein